MKYDDFLGRLQIRMGFDRDEADRATQAVLQALGECMELEPGSHFASQLPVPMNEYLLRRQTHERYSVEGLYERVSDLARVAYPQGLARTKAVTAVLRETITPEMLADLRRIIPESVCREFFDAPEQHRRVGG